MGRLLGFRLRSGGYGSVTCRWFSCQSSRTQLIRAAASRASPWRYRVRVPVCPCAPVHLCPCAPVSAPHPAVCPPARLPAGPCPPAPAPHRPPCASRRGGGAGRAACTARRRRATRSRHRPVRVAVGGKPSSTPRYTSQILTPKTFIKIIYYNDNHEDRALANNCIAYDNKCGIISVCHQGLAYQSSVQFSQESTLKLNFMKIYDFHFCIPKQTSIIICCFPIGLNSEHT